MPAHGTLERLGNLMAGLPGIDATDQQIALRRRVRSRPKALRIAFQAKPQNMLIRPTRHMPYSTRYRYGERLTDDVHFGHRVWVHDSDVETWLAPGAQCLFKKWELKQDRTPLPPAPTSRTRSGRYCPSGEDEGDELMAFSYSFATSGSGV